MRMLTMLSYFSEYWIPRILTFCIVSFFSFLVSQLKSVHIPPCCCNKVWLTMRNQVTDIMPRATMLLLPWEMYSSNKKNKHHATLRECDTLRILLNCVAVFASHSSKFYTMAKPLIYLNSPRVGDQADIIFIAEILFLEKSKIFHLHFRRTKFSFLHPKLAWNLVLYAQKQTQQRERRFH